MARNIHWRIQFRTRSEKLGVLNLYEDNYSGEVVELTPSAVPFETQEDSSDKWFVPIRKQTGYIRILDEGNIDGIIPVGMKDRYVEYTEDGSLKWCGYVAPDVFSSDWDAVENEIELPVIGGLGVLESEYMNEDDGLGVVRLANIINECIQKTGVNYERIFLPKEVLSSYYDTDYLFPLTVEVSRFNFFEQNDALNIEDADWKRYAGETFYEVLSEIMKFYGWTIRERGNEVWITSTVNLGSVSITNGELNALAIKSGAAINVISVESTEHDIELLELAGSDNKRDILQGRKKVVVKADINEVGIVVPSVDKSMMKFTGTILNEFKDMSGVYAYEKLNLFTPKNGYTDVVLRSYYKSSSEWISVGQSIGAMSSYLGAYFVEQEKVKKEDYQKKKNWNFTETIRINLKDDKGYYPTDEEALNMPIIELSSKSVANYINGAFVISAQTRSSTYGFLFDYDGNGNGTMAVKFSVGNNFWNGTDWVNSPAWFNVEMGNEEDRSKIDGTGKIISTKTLDMPYNGADGYVMPINRSLSGSVKMTIHAVKGVGDVKTVLMLDNLKVDYYGVDSDFKSEQSENRYTRITGKNYNEVEEISLRLATDNNNNPGYGILSIRGENIETMYFPATGMTMRPEINLLSKGEMLYRKNTEKLTLQLEVFDARPHDILTSNGKKYVLASEAVNWQEETAQYIIMEV